MYVPATQAAQLEEDECPEAVVTVDAMTVPAAHCTHAIAPVDATYCPTPQTVQMVDKVNWVYMPTGQGVQAATAPVAYVPAAQGKQFDIDEKAATVVPVR